MKKLLLVLALALGLAPGAEAAYLSGSTAYVLVNANVIPAEAPYNAASTITADRVIVGGSASGDFLDGTVGNGGLIDLFGAYSPFTYNPKIVPISPFISFNGINGNNTFTITDFTVDVLLVNLVAVGVVIDATGYWTGAGYDPTLGNFTLSGTRIPTLDQFGVPIPGDFSYGVSGTLNAAGAPADIVPEPASMVLLGTGLVGLASAARRRRKAAK